MDLRNENIGGTKHHFTMSNWVAGINVTLWGRDRGKESTVLLESLSGCREDLAFSLCWFLCNLRVHISLKNDVIISKESERIWFLLLYFKIQLVHFHWCVFIHPVLFILRTSNHSDSNLRMENWSPNPEILTWCWGEGHGGGGESREEHHIPHFPGDHWKRPEREIKGLA